MTLSGWFREYVYIPLGGNRKGLARQLFNLFVVWAAHRHLARGQLELYCLGPLLLCAAHA